MISWDVGLWLQAILIIMYLTQLYKNNFLYRFAEGTLVAVAIGHGAVLAYRNVVSGAIKPLLGGEFLVIIPMILGALIWSRLSRSYGWVSRWPMAVIIGSSAAVAARGAIKAQIIDQLTGIVSLALYDPKAGLLGLFNSWFIIVLAIATITYFVFFKAHTGALGKSARLGRLAMMTFFGFTIAQVFLGRLASLIAQLQVLLLQWLGLG